MIAKKLRLDLRRERGFFGHARVLRLPHLRVYAAPSTEKTMLFAVSVKKTHGKAVERGQSRRRIATALNDLFVQRPADFSRSYHVVFMPLGGPQEYSVYMAEIAQFFDSLV